MKTKEEIQKRIQDLLLEFEIIKNRDDGAFGYGLLKIKNQSKLQALKWVLEESE